jgi:medium-chain acyl-[acyl-carrier-protein] hydrolase
MAASAKTGDPWIVRPKPSPAPALRVFCFPYAGLGVSVFRPWPAAFPPNVELVLMQPPGREGRWSEKPYLDMSTFAGSATDALLPYLDVPFVFFGHSLGALVSFEVARRLRRHRRAQPLHLFVSAHRAAQLPNPHPEIRGFSDREFIDQICRQYGGIPQAVLDSPDLIELMLPCLRADFNVFETYRYSDEAPLACSMTAFGGTRDRRVSEPEVAAWREQTTGDFRCQMFEGGHFFFQDRRDDVLDSIKRDLVGVGLAPAGL